MLCIKYSIIYKISCWCNVFSVYWFWSCASIFRYGSFWIFIITNLRIFMMISTLEHIFKSAWSILSTVSSSTSNFFLISLSAQYSDLCWFRFRMVPYSIWRCKGRADFNHPTTILHLWTLSIILHDIFPGIPNKSFREHLSLNSNLNC